jgi:hypothetical protein
LAEKINNLRQREEEEVERGGYENRVAEVRKRP